VAEVGSAFVSILPSAKGFGKNLTKQVEPDTKKAGKSIGASLGKAFAIAGGAAAVVGFFKGSISEAREAQKVGALTAQVIKTTGGAANVTAGQVATLAESLSKKTGIDDEVIQSGENMLLTFKNIRNEAGAGNDVFNQSTKVLTDMSAALGVEPKKAAIQLGKALNDPIKGVTALSRVGVTFTEKQKKVIKSLTESGHRLDAQKIILHELTTEFGGAAEAQATAGDKAKVAFGNMQETIGTALLPTLDKLSNFFTGKVAPAVQKFVGEMQSGKGAGGDFAATLDSVGDAGKAAFNAVEPLVKLAGSAVGAFGKLPGPIKTLAVEVGLAALVFPRLSRAISGVGGSFTNPIARVKQFGAEMSYAETRAAHVNRIVGGLKDGAGVAGLAALADGARRANGPMKELETVGGAALMGFSVGGPIGAAVVGGGTALFRLATAGQRAGKRIEDAKPGIGSIIGTLDQVTGAASRATKALTFNAITKQGGFTALNKARSLYGGLAITQRDLVQASMGNAKAQSRVVAAFKVGEAAVKERNKDLGGKGYFNVRNYQKATNDLNKIIGVNAKQNAKASAKTRELYRATAPTAELLKHDLAAGAKNSSRTIADLSRNSQRGTKSVNGLGSAVKKVPGKKDVDLNVNTHDGEGKVRRLRDEINSLQDRTIHILTVTNKPKVLPGNAAGTDFWRGGPTWVGERGPEIVNLPRGAQVIPNHQIGGAGGRQAITITNWRTGTGYIESLADGRVLAHAGVGRESVRSRR
jgi:hypothetical protein